jgi:hypothetical protein
MKMVITITSLPPAPLSLEEQQPEASETNRREPQ